MWQPALNVPQAAQQAQSGSLSLPLASLRAQSPPQQVVQLGSALGLYMENRSPYPLLVELYALNNPSPGLTFILDPQEYKSLVLPPTSQLRVSDLTQMSINSVPILPVAEPSLLPPFDVTTGGYLYLTWSSAPFQVASGARAIGGNVPPNYVQIVGPSTGNQSGTVSSSSPAGFTVKGPFTALKLVNTNATTNLGFSLDGGALQYIGVSTTVELDNINAESIGYVFGGGGCTLYAWQYCK